MIQTTVTRSTIEELLAHADIAEARYGYSGRGMYGAGCFGIVGSATDLVRFATSVAGAAWTGDSPEMQALLDTLRSERVAEDSMGRSAIFYWPSIAVTEADGTPASGDWDPDGDYL